MWSKGWITSPLREGVEELDSARVFFSHFPVVQAIFGGAVYAFFYIHSYYMIFFLL